MVVEGTTTASATPWYVIVVRVGDGVTVVGYDGLSPDAERPWVRRKLRAAWANPAAADAKAALEALARQLKKVNPDAATSLREGLDETLNRHPPRRDRRTLLKTVMSTNPAESMIEIVRAHAQ